MFNFILLLLNSLFRILFSNRKDLILTMMVLKKENLIYKQQFKQKQIQDLMRRSDRYLFAIISAISNRAVRHLTIIKPSTLLDWQQRFIKNFWSYKHKTPGRKSVSNKIKKLILEMKQNNPLWGCHRIADELKKIGINLQFFKPLSYKINSPIVSKSEQQWSGSTAGWIRLSDLSITR